MDWFECLTGFAEQSPEQVKQHLTLEHNRLCSTVNQQCWSVGHLTLPSLAELRANATALPGRLQVSEVIGDVQTLHADPSNAGALFQVASQFNLLEMVSPRVTPEQGVGIYGRDFTQGPACAIAAGAATIYRNYFADVNGQQGQSSSQQLDGIADLGAALGNTNNALWQMQNGYVMASEQGLAQIQQQLRSISHTQREQLKGLLRIGVHADIDVTLPGCNHQVTQALCSALPLAYSRHDDELWTEFAQLILEAAYEATLAAAVQNAQATGNNRVYLTLLGGGAFGNPDGWIMDAIRKALLAYQDSGLWVGVVSHSQSNEWVSGLICEII